MYEEIEDKRIIPDGVWDITGLDYVLATAPYVGKWDKETRKIIKTEKDEEILKEWKEKISTFKEKHPDWAIADAYQTEHPILIERMPTEKVKYIGSGFNHGANNLIDNCPHTILILGEDD